MTRKLIEISKKVSGKGKLENGKSSKNKKLKKENLRKVKR